MSKIFVLGSINMDLVVTAPRMPKRGESVRGEGFLTNQGGKGANQAVAAAKLGGAEVYLIAAVGSDEFGGKLSASVAGYGVRTDYLVQKGGASGVTVIMLDMAERDNRLIVDWGANGKLTPEDAANALRRGGAGAGDVFVTQLEVPLQTVKAGLAEAVGRGMTTILNPAPYTEIGRDILELTDYLVPNETEAEALCGISVRGKEEAEEAYRRVRNLGAKRMIVTLGERGAALCTPEKVRQLPAYPAQAVDTTAAGDTFIGAFAARLAAGADAERAADFAMRCAAVTVTRPGASASIPTLAEVPQAFCN